MSGFEEIDALYRAVTDLTSAEALRRIDSARQSASSTLRPRIEVVQARLHTRTGDFELAATVIARLTGSDLELRARVELLRCQSALYTETGNTKLALTTAIRAIDVAVQAGTEDEARARFRGGLASCHVNRLGDADGLFRLCQEATTSSSFRSMALVNRSIIAASRDELGRATQLLGAVAGEHLGSLSKSEAAYYHRSRAMILAKSGRALEAIAAQSRCADLIGEHRPLDRACAAAELAAYQVEAGDSGAAEATVIAASRLAASLPRQDRAAGAILTELVRLGLEKRLTSQSALEIASKIRQFKRPERRGRRGRPRRRKE